MISVKNLTKNYPGRRAIDDISFEIRQGEIIGLLGLNGAGKSTILKILGSFLEPSGGDATIEGISVSENPEKIREIIGYLPDAPPLYNEMTIYKYLKFVAALKNVSKENTESYIRDVMNRLDLVGESHTQMGNLSHGYRQRVGIAQAMIHKPKVLIFDEPINGLDPIQIVEMRDVILSLKKDHTIILSSHILSEITKTCDRILIIDKGCLVAEGTEQSLNANQTDAMKIECVVESCTDALVESIKNLEGVEEVSVKNHSGSGATLTLSTSRDMRVSLSKRIVESGSGLIQFTKLEDGLEKLFMKLVKKSDNQTIKQ